MDVDVLVGFSVNDLPSGHGYNDSPAICTHNLSCPYRRINIGKCPHQSYRSSNTIHMVYKYGEVTLFGIGNLG